MTSTDHDAKGRPKPRRIDFGIVWMGQGVSSIGTAVTTLVLPLVALVTLHAAAWQVSLLTAATYTAYAVLALPAGVWLDHRHRRPVVLGADACRAIVIASVPVAAVAGGLTMAQLVMVALALGVFGVFFDVAYQSWLPGIVPPARLVRANGLLAATDAAGRLAGPGIGGALYAAIGGAATLWLDAASFVVAACSTALVKAREHSLPLRPRDRVPLRDELKIGSRWLVRARPLRNLVAALAWMNLFVAVWLAVEVTFLVRTLHTASGTAGIVLALGSTGGILGGLLSARVADSVGDARALVVCAAIAGPCALIVPSTTAVFGPWAMSIGLFGVLAANAMFTTISTSYRQRIVPPHLLARVTSAIRLLTFAVLPLGALLGGLLVGLTSPRNVLVIAAIGYGSAVVWLGPISRDRDLRTTNHSAATVVP
ncbi:MFS transporter [Flexivirga caeni]|uniref:MFS transporter n=1 Tax=Flexivirga caeni TaxID=2294115 RepID=A0A3M9MEG1_9MICO|nr:MFS transporter [Flexivirga caeni]RNI23874.1 MFS transporter [Flexivirga caeni]